MKRRTMEKETVKAYLLTELTAEFISDEQEGEYWEEDDLVQMDGSDLARYEDSIREYVQKENEWLKDGNLACYMGDTPHGLKEKVLRIQPDVAVQEGKLYGCTVLEFKEEPREREWNALLDYISGQYSDGWGEGFEQRDIPVGNGILNVHFWQEDGWYQVMDNDPRIPPAPSKPKMKLLGEDGNIFAILGRAGRLLRENGQGDLVQEITRRVQDSGDYYKALTIISEYVQTELSEPSGAEERAPKQNNRSQQER